ncbi:MAG: hypothetical protein HY037_00260 [Nitrospirae bacterium]|nr:hypothetical protein [Candidatus Troglogloeales bacterium]
MARKTVRYGLSFVFVLLLSSVSWAGQLEFSFVSPSFGGSPLNGQYLLAYAGAQNEFKDNSSPRLPDVSKLSGDLLRLSRRGGVGGLGGGGDLSGLININAGDGAIQITR